MTPDEAAEWCTAFAPPGADGSPWPFDNRWLSETVVALARAIDAEKAFDRLPILADALEEAGCDDQVILTHCRVCVTHDLDCWAVKYALEGELMTRPEVLAERVRSAIRQEQGTATDFADSHPRPVPTALKWVVRGLALYVFLYVLSRIAANQ